MRALRYIFKRINIIIHRVQKKLYLLRRFTKGSTLIHNIIVNQLTLFDIKDRHVWFGYYDLPQINADGDKLAVLVTGRNADPSIDIAEIGYFDISIGEYHKLTTTSAWCWQQGSRLRWHPLDSDKLLYNDIQNNKYVTKEINIYDKKIRVLSPALYDISYDMKYGVSINFARLQRLRPGYGYSTLPDLSTDTAAPADDGVVLLDLESNTQKLTISLDELSRSNDESNTYEHYINHVSFCPDGSKFMFFHVADGRSKGKIVELYIYDINNDKLELLETEWKTSHYTWRNNNELMTTSSKKGVVAYSIYNLSNQSKHIIEHNALNEDGHPTFFDNVNIFVYDTYPDISSYQKVALFDMVQYKSETLAEFYHKTAKSIDMRCDLHPRLWERNGETIITLDTTCSGGVRKVALLKL